MTLAVLLAACMTVTVAAVGPLYAAAAGRSTFTDRLRVTPSSRSGLEFRRTGSVSDPGLIPDTVNKLQSVRIRGYLNPILGVSLPITASTPGQVSTVTSTLVWRSGECAHLRVLSGRCPLAAGEAMVDDNTLHDRPNWRLGSSLAVYKAVPDVAGQAATGPRVAQATIVGSYRPLDEDDPFWFGAGYFAAHLGSGSGVTAIDLVDAVFIARPGLAAIDPGTSGVLTVDYPIDIGAARLDTSGTLTLQARALHTSFPSLGSESSISLRTDIDAVVHAATVEQRQINTATLLAIVELAALSWLALCVTVGYCLQAQSDDLALAKLRGLSSARTLGRALAEPLAVLVLSLPVGMLAALGIVRLLAARVLVAGTHVVVNDATWVSVAIAFIGGAVACVGVSARAVKNTVFQQWQRPSSTASPAGRWIRWGTGAIALAAVGALGAALSEHSTEPNAGYLLVPGLTVFAVAAAGSRLLPLMCRAGLEPTRRTQRIGLFLALRQTVRRPGAARLAMLLAVALGLATFAAAGESIAVNNRTARAQAELGAHQVASVQYQPAHDPQNAVARADPDGLWAMAAATWNPDGGVASGTITGQVLAVEPARLAAVATAVRGLAAPAQLAAQIRTPTAVPATFVGQKIRVRVDTSSATGDPVTVDINVRQSHTHAASVATHRLTLGNHLYAATVPCALGCTFTGITFDSPAGSTATITTRVLVTAVEASRDGNTFHPLALDLNGPRSWRGLAIGYDGAVDIARTSTGLAARTVTRNGSSALISYADTPSVIPVVAAPHALTGGTTGAMQDYTGAQSLYTIARTTPVLPAVLDAGVLADLDYLRVQLPDFDYEAAWSVWIGPTAPPDAVARLRDAGLFIQSVHSQTERAAALGRQGPALSLLLLVVCAVASSFIALVGAAVAQAVGARRRAFEMAALRTLGVSRAAAIRAHLIEQLLPICAAVLLGAPTGYLVARVGMPLVPEFSDTTPIELVFSPAVAVVVQTVLGLSVALLITALAAAIWQDRLAVPARLREVAA